MIEQMKERVKWNGSPDQICDRYLPYIEAGFSQTRLSQEEIETRTIDILEMIYDRCKSSCNEDETTLDETIYTLIDEAQEKDKVHNIFYQRVKGEVAVEPEAAPVLEAAMDDQPIVNRVVEHYTPQRSYRFIIIAAIIIILVLLLWFTLGGLMTAKIIPRIDLGYGWFNTHFREIF